MSEHKVTQVFLLVIITCTKSGGGGLIKNRLLACPTRMGGHIDTEI